MGKRMNMPRGLKRIGPGKPHLIPLIFNDLCLVWWGTLLEQRWPKRRRLPRVSKLGDRCAAQLHTRSSVTLMRGGGTLHVTVRTWWRSSTWTWAPIIVSGFLLLKELCVLSRIHLLYLLKLVCFILSWGGIFTLVRLTWGALSQCLNFGPSSEP